MSNRFTNQTVTQIALWNPTWVGSSEDHFAIGVHMLPECSDQEATRLHQEKLGVNLTRLADKQVLIHRH